MSILTPFFNLIKPAKTDGVKVSDFNANMDVIDTEMHKPPLTVNNTEPDANRNIYLETVPLADNLTSDEAQINIGTYLERTSGGDASIDDGDASLSTIKGNMIKTGYVAEVLDMTVSAVPRVAPAAITASIDNATFEAYVETAGTYTMTYGSSGWDYDPEDYGITVTNAPVEGDSITVVWDGENDPVMTVNAVTREVPPAITATINKDTFRAYVATSGTVTLSYTTAWSANPALYGITVQNTPVSGDSISVEYVKEDRGTITPANVSAFNSTGWNLYNNDTGKAKVIKYSDSYGYFIGGTYSIVAFATTPDGTPSAVTVNDGYFNIPSNGYIIVTGGDATTYIYPTWSDWLEGYEGDFETYTVDTIDLSSIMVNFTAGLCAIGEVRDELNFNIQKAYSRIQRLSYTAENLSAVISAGRPYDTDTNYIYAVRETPVEYSFSVDGTYTVSDHGIEFFTASSTTPVVTETLYGENLKDKLRTDVLTISQQTLSTAQKATVRSNIGAASAADVATKFADVEGGMAIVIDGNTAPKAITSGQYLFIKNHSTLATGGYHATANIAQNANVTSSNVSADTNGIVNAAYASLNSKLTDENFTISLPSGYSWNNARTRKTEQGLVFISGRIDITAASSSKEINLGTIIPEGCRPYGSNVTFTAYNNSTDRPIHGIITTAGGFLLYRPETESLSTIVLSVMYATW